MTDPTKKWTTVSESEFPWERDALEFVRDRFPGHEPYRAWSNFEFIADDGSVNEVDLLVFSPSGFFLIEIKSRPGVLQGDAGAWIWRGEGRTVTADNPVILANSKAKKLRALLQRQRVAKMAGDGGEIPFIEPLVFCSAPGLSLELKGTAAHRVCVRDAEDGEGVADASPSRPGIMAAIKRRECPGLPPRPRGTHDRPTAGLVGRAMERAGIRPSQRSRKVSDYLLERVIDEGPGHQDWRARHVRLPDHRRRVRIYHARRENSREDRQRLERAALREFQILDELQHPGILRAHGFSEHELGPALIFEHDPLEIRLDHYLAQRGDSLGLDARLDLVRQIAEAVRYAHEKKVVHRGLSPQSILVVQPPGKPPEVKLFNWRLGFRTGGSGSETARSIAATSHVDRLVDDSSQAYMAPEAIADDGDLGEHLDVFSLGALAHHIFSGEPPAPNALELANKLRETRGLNLFEVMNGAKPGLQDLVRLATHPIVGERTSSAADFLEGLERVEDELTTPERDEVVDPRLARKGDALPGGLMVLGRLGRGGSSIAFRVERDGREFVLKVADDPEHDARIREEAAILEKLRHHYIVEVVETVEIAERAGFLMRPVYAQREPRKIETLGQRLRQEGRLQIEFLQRFGADILEALVYLEEQGIPHRDVKPDNIAVGSVGRGDTLHAVLFDFSLARAPLDDIRAGTRGYLDPFLALRKPPGWDSGAERYAAAVTLYEMATGTLPRWGDGVTAPDQLDCEATIDADLFDVGLREPLSAFFARALRRDAAQRFDNAEGMLEAWRRCFAGIDESTALSDQGDDETLRAAVASATLDTLIHDLGLGARATNALDRADVLTVEDLLTVPSRRLLRLRGVGAKTRSEIAQALAMLKERLGAHVEPGNDDDQARDEPADLASLGLDSLFHRLVPVARKGRGDASNQIIRALLGLDPTDDDDGDEHNKWPSQSDAAKVRGVTRARVGQVVARFLERWRRDPALGLLREEVAEFLGSAGGALSVDELVEAALLARGGVEDEPLRSRLARAVVRAAVETERSAGDSSPRFLARRSKNRVVVAVSQDAAKRAFALGDLADKLADEDPLVSPDRLADRLREAAPDGLDDIDDARLIRLAVAASSRAALSSRRELYPKGMNAGRALKLSRGALHGVASLTIDELRDRVEGRYPAAERLPNMPELETMIREAGIDREWDPTAEGVGAFVERARDLGALNTSSGSLARYTTASVPVESRDATPEVADARRFEQRLQRGLEQRAFLALVVPGRAHQRAWEELTRRFPVELVDFEELFIKALRRAADEVGARWDVVLRADAQPRGGAWDRLMILVNRAVDAVEQELFNIRKSMLIIHAGPLARYDRMDVVQRLRDAAGRRDGIPGVWLLIPGSAAMIDGKAVPVVGPAQRVGMPEAWIENRHRGGGDV